jgi:putative solute:sodium symporter small subunit
MKKKYATETKQISNIERKEIEEIKNTILKKKYWKQNLIYLRILLTVWFICSFGFGILMAEYLNNFYLGGFPLGFWFAQQGSIYIFVILIFIYVYLMNKLDEKYNLKE